MNKHFLHTDKTRGYISTTTYANLHDEDNVKKCTCCGQYMAEGYVINGGEEYFCSQQCIDLTHPKAYIESLEIGEDNSDSYWTTWEEIEVDNDGRTLQEYIDNAEVGDVWENSTDKYVMVDSPKV